jgi:RecB family exonuclease
VLRSLQVWNASPRARDAGRDQPALLRLSASLNLTLRTSRAQRPSKKVGERVAADVAQYVRKRPSVRGRSWRWRASVFDSCPPGEASEQHRHDASEEYTIESPGAADRGDRRAEPADGIEI